ncbi:MAG: 50S ribosomal protein L10 [Candidatus Brocadiaceae bacterium]|nr:50S ribosomal protein L10 [Candidatus Brocadiaceae bacterium]
MPQQVKELMLKELTEEFRDIRRTGCVVVGYHGMKADESRLVRQEARRQGSRMMVVKNSLFARAASDLGACGLSSLLDGPTAVVQGPSAVEAARAAQAMARACAALEVRGVYVDGQVLGPEGVRKLADIPNRETLLSMFAGALMAPLRRLAGGLLDRPRALLNVLEQMKDRKAGGSADSQRE